MIAAGDAIDACAEQFAGGGGRDAGAAGGIFAVGDDEMKAVPLAQHRHELRHRLPARRADDVSDEKNFHGRN